MHRDNYVDVIESSFRIINRCRKELELLRRSIELSQRNAYASAVLCHELENGRTGEREPDELNAR